MGLAPVIILIMKHLIRYALAATILLTGVLVSGCASKTKAEKEDEYEPPYEWVEIPGSRVRKKVYIGETYDGGPAPTGTISKRQLDDMQNATRAPAGVGTP